MKREQRRAAIRATDANGKPGVTLKAITPHIVDDYGSVFMPDTFDESLALRMPTLCWSHDWSEPLGPAIDHRTGEGGPEIDFAFSDFDAVPMARRAHAQVQDGTILDCSVGFSGTERRKPTPDEQQRWPGVTEIITKATLDEVSLVLRGAVPGAKVLSVRSGKVDVDAVVELARRVAAGELTDAEAKAAIDLLADTEQPPAADPPAPEVDPPAAPDFTAIDLEADAAIDQYLERSRR